VFVSRSHRLAIRTQQQLVEETTSRRFIPKLYHVDDASAMTFVAELDGNAGFADTLHPIREYNRRNYHRVIFGVRFNNQLLDMRWMLMEELETRCTK